MDNEKDKMEHDMKDLRTKSSATEGVKKFRKSLLGGIDEKEVEEYIVSLTRQFGRAEGAYKERIDEFTVHADMLAKECSDALDQLRIKEDEIQRMKAEEVALKSELSGFQKRMLEDKSRIEELESKETEEAKADLKKENELLKDDLSGVCRERDRLAGELAVLTMQLQETKTALEASGRDLEALRDEFVEYRGGIRRAEMEENTAWSRFSEKQSYAASQAAQKLKETLSIIDGIKNDFYEARETVNQNKTAEK